MKNDNLASDIVKKSVDHLVADDPKVLFPDTTANSFFELKDNRVRSRITSVNAKLAFIDAVIDKHNIDIPSSWYNLDGVLDLGIVTDIFYKVSTSTKVAKHKKTLKQQAVTPA